MRLRVYKPEDILKLNYPVIFLDGEEYYFKLQIIDAYKEKFSHGSGNIFNFQEINPDNWDNDRTFRSNIMQMGFFAKRFILINYFDRFSITNQQKILDIILKSGLKNNNSIFILIVSGGKVQIDSKSSFKMTFNKFINNEFVGYVYLYPLLEGDLKKYIVKYVQDKGKRIDPADIDYILNGTDNDLLSIIKELDKIILYIGEKEKISLDDINNVSSDFKIVNIFDFCDAVFFGHRDKALIFLDRIIDESTTGWDIKLLQTMWWVFKRNAKIAYAIKNKENESNILNLINAPYFKKNKIFNNIKLLTNSYLSRQIDALYELEFFLKTKASNNILRRKAFENFIFQVPLLTH